MKLMRLAEPAEAVKARVEAFLAADPDAELVGHAYCTWTGRRRPRPRAGLYLRFFDFAFAHKSAG